jgi:hypothetical protein
VHEVPSGAFIDVDDAGNTSITVDGAVTATYPPRPCTTSGRVGPLN